MAVPALDVENPVGMIKKGVNQDVVPVAETIAVLQELKIGMKEGEPRTTHNEGGRGSSRADGMLMTGGPLEDLVKAPVKVLGHEGGGKGTTDRTRGQVDNRGQEK